MLTRFAAIAARSWTPFSGARVCTSSTSKISLLLFARHLTHDLSQRDDPESPKLFAKIVRKRVVYIQRTLRIPEAARVLPSSPDEIEQWTEAIKVPDFDVAVKNCEKRLLSAPTWVLFYLLSNKVHTPSQAMLAATIMLGQIPKVDKILQPAIVILVVRFLAKQQVAMPIPSLIKLFLILDLPNPSMDFNFLLRAMSNFHPSPIPSKAAVRIIETMHGRQIKLQSRTYRALLSNDLVTLELAKKLQQSMALEGIQPNRHHLEAYLRVFAHHGAVHASARYLNLIRERVKEEDEIKVPHGIEFSSQGPRAVKSENSANTRWNTEFLKSFKNQTGSAFHYLRSMVDEKDVGPITLGRVRKESRLGNPTRKDRPFLWKHRTHVSDWATLLNSAARNKRFNSDTFLKLFDEARAASGFPPTVGIFTILVRGLARKGDFATAMSVWKRCLASWSRRRKIDTRALTVAMEVIVANGRPLEAFDTLVNTTGILINHSMPPRKLHPRAIGRRYERALFSKYAKIDVPLVNALMNAYQKNGRPDLVFKLWDEFYHLFGVNPNSDTLTIVLDAASSVARWDRTFRGLLEQLGLHDLFSRYNPTSSAPQKRTRRQVVQQIQDMIDERPRSSSSPEGPAASEGEPGEEKTQREEVSREAKKYIRKTLWNGELAAQKAIKLFQDIVLGNYPELRRIIPPATAVWPDEAYSASPFRDALSSLGSRLRGGAEPEKPTSAEILDGPKPLLFGPSLRPSSSSPPQSQSQAQTPDPLFTSLSSSHPQITPNSQSFASYLLLLGRTNRASQIPVTLAWMRYLHVRPIKRSLAIAIALWSEASMRGPLIERYGGRESEFEKLYEWLVDWLGEEGMPSEAAVSWAFRKLKQERES